jgi:hypothetical protein
MLSLVTVVGVRFERVRKNRPERLGREASVGIRLDVKVIGNALGEVGVLVVGGLLVGIVGVLVVVARGLAELVGNSVTPVGPHDRFAVLDRLV